LAERIGVVWWEGTKPQCAAGSVRREARQDSARADGLEARPSTVTVNFTSAGLREAGFAGFETVAKLRETTCGSVPRSPGVYVVLRDAAEPPIWVDPSPGGWFKKRDPTVASTILTAKMVAGTPVMYIGKADVLHKRLGDYLKFGSGKAVGHWGGRYIWQIADSEDLVIAWRETKDPTRLEGDLLRDFTSQFGALPFANLRF
jgi:hypothetical protein